MISTIRERLKPHRSVLIGSALMFVLLLAGGLFVEGFLSSSNLRSMLVLAAFLGLASLGQTVCALVGGIDMSIAYVIGACNILLAGLLNWGVPPVLAIAIVFAGGVLLGIANGVLSFKLQGQALILTLGVGFATVGATQIITSIGSEYAGNVMGEVPPWLANISAMGGDTFGIPVPPIVLIWAAVAFAVVYMMNRSYLGRSFYAVGGGRTAAARLMVSEFKIWVLAYAISGGMAALTGIILLGFSGGGFVGVGDPYLFTTVAAVVIGGTSLLGGWGGYGSTVIGVIVLTVLTSLLVGLGLDYAGQQVIFGLIIVPMVAFYARSPHIRMQI